MTGFVGVAVPEHVDRPGGEVLGVCLEVAYIGFGVTAGTVQEHQCGLGRIACVQIPGAHSACIEVALRERDALEIAPDAFVLRHPATPLLTRTEFSQFVSTLLIY